MLVTIVDPVDQPRAGKRSVRRQEDVGEDKESGVAAGVQGEHDVESARAAIPAPRSAMTGAGEAGERSLCPCSACKCAISRNRRGPRGILRRPAVARNDLTLVRGIA